MLLFVQTFPSKEQPLHSGDIPSGALLTFLCMRIVIVRAHNVGPGGTPQIRRMLFKLGNAVP